MVEDLVEKVEVYRCLVCKEIIGSREEAEKHARIPVSKPLPVGFVYGYPRYFIVTSNEGKPTKTHDFVQDGYWIETPTFISNTGISTRDIRNFFSQGVSMNEEELKRFKEFYETCKEVQKIIRVKPTDITNKFD